MIVAESGGNVRSWISDFGFSISRQPARPVVAADQAGCRIVRLPQACDVFDPFTGQRQWSGVTAFEREFHAKETAIWRLADQD